MKTSPVWISAEVQVRIESPPILLVKKEPKKFNKYDIIKIKKRRNLSDANSETYKVKIVTFEHIGPE